MLKKIITALKFLKNKLGFSDSYYSSTSDGSMLVKLRLYLIYDTVRLLSSLY